MLFYFISACAYYRLSKIFSVLFCYYSKCCSGKILACPFVHNHYYYINCRMIAKSMTCRSTNIHILNVQIYSNTALQNFIMTHIRVFVKIVISPHAHSDLGLKILLSIPI